MTNPNIPTSGGNWPLFYDTEGSADLKQPYLCYPCIHAAARVTGRVHAGDTYPGVSDNLFWKMKDRMIGCWADNVPFSYT